ncbi:MAG: hypothetical protein ACTSP4_00565 [Candidatus Hodarchaeales archaeon]
MTSKHDIARIAKALSNEKQYYYRIVKSEDYTSENEYFSANNIDGANSVLVTIRV